MMFLQASALLALAASVSGHIIMGSPVPFDWENSATQQSPLEVSDFPCKQPSGKYAISTMNQYKAGDSIDVKLIGGATHGGGSCQFSITTDTKPNKDTQWKVLFSQIGGCPGGPPNDNKSGDRNDQGNAPFKVTLPKDLPSGQYTFAWSWNNKLGNREFYMNCAPLQITGGSGDVSKVLGSLPDMFVINLPSTQCALGVGQDVLYPNPGKAVATASAASPGLKIEGAGCGAMTKLGAGAGKLGSPAQATGAPAGAAPAPKPTNGGIFAPGAGSSGSPAGVQPTAGTAQPTQPATPQPATPQPAAPQPAAPKPATPQPTGTTGTSTGASGCSPCTEDGAVVCIGTTSFGICSRGCAVAQPLAAGTTCSNGKIARRSLFPRGYLSQLYN